MALLSKPILSKEQRLEQLRASNAAVDDMFKNGLDDTRHFKILAAPTIEAHDYVRGQWRDFVGYHDTDLPSELEMGIAHISEGSIKMFILYLSGTIAGRLENFASRATIVSYLNTFFACLSRYAGQLTPRPVRDQLKAFVYSQEVLDATPLSTKMRPKPIATSQDLDAAISFVWSDTAIFPTTRGKAQFNAVNILCALTSQRPGAIIESSCYEDTNEAILWEDIEIIVIPNPKDPKRPHIVIGITFRLNKAQRGIDAHFRTVFILLEPLGGRHACFGTLILYMALQDAALRDVSHIDEILKPKFPPVRANPLVIAEACRKQPVFRAEVVEDGVYVVSPTKALKAGRHNDHLKKVFFALGYPINITTYGWRRGAGHTFNKILKETERRALMGHAGGSHVYEDSYQARTLTYNLGGLLHGRERNPEAEALAESATSMSVHADPDALTRLDVHDIAEMERDETLVEMRQRTQQYRARADALILQLKSLDPAAADHDEEHADLHGQLRTALITLREHSTKYVAIVTREKDALLKAKRKAFFDGSSLRQLTGTTRRPLVDVTRQSFVPRRIPVVRASGKENGGAPAMSVADKDLTAPPPSVADTDLVDGATPTSVADTDLVAPAPSVADNDLIDPHAALVRVLYHSQEEELAEDVMAAVTTYLGAPVRRFALCYPGECPTQDEKCPVCSIDCRRGSFNKKSGSVGEHIHKCFVEAQSKKAQEQADTAYIPRCCQWAGCEHAESHTMFQTRAEFVTHLQYHLEHVDACCEWKVNGEECSEDWDDTDGDWDRHFAEAHSINASLEIEVQYCNICPEWHVDDLGHGLKWQSHLWDHYKVLFKRFESRADGEVDRVPIDVEFSPPCDNTVSYDNGSGFDGQLPEFHGHVVDRIPLVPMHCPFCIFDTSLDIQARMKQWTRNDNYYNHLQIHDQDVDEDKNICPVPSCGKHEYSRFDLETHLIAFHRVPLYSTKQNSILRRLNLPPPPSDPDAPAVDPAHLHDDMDVDEPGPEPVLPPTIKLTKATQRKIMSRQRREQRESDASNAVKGWCYGCSRSKADIGKHLTSSGKCGKKNQYSLMKGKEKVGGKLAWSMTASRDTTSRSRKGKADANHRCEMCRNQVVDILVHVKECTSPVPPTHFHIMTRVSLGGNKYQRKNGPRLSIKEWSKQQPVVQPVEAQPVASSSKRRRSQNSSDEDDDSEDDYEEPAPVASSSKRRRSQNSSDEDDDSEDDDYEEPAPKLIRLVRFFRHAIRIYNIVVQDPAPEETASSAFDHGKQSSKSNRIERTRAAQKMIRLNERPDLLTGVSLQWVWG
ncbi:hypothetical protein K438DRAFT_431447 [Mycena galopus ATCC 62051]|nr:hypothetical protein K438DRAFT_431447 [Mycena galopus ATCC 62051]